MGAKQVRSVFPNADETNITSFSYCELYGNKKLASLGDVVDLPLINFGSRDWLFEVMPKVPGVTLEKLIKGTRIINNEKRLNIFRKIGILLNELNYHKNFCHGCLHLKNIIVDPITENVSLIDWDHCFKKDPSIQDYRTDAELIFWITFSDRILTPIMQSTPSELKTQWGNICNLTSCLRSLLSCSLEKDYGRINICDSECYLDRLQILINHYIKDIDDEDLDQRISMACRFLRPFLPFFTRNFQTPLIANKEEEYYKRVSALFLAIFKESDLTSGEISDMEQKLNLPPKEWHCSFLRRDI
jgi:hypothetical protein